MKSNLSRKFAYSMCGFALVFSVGCLTLKENSTPVKTRYLTIGTGGANGVYYPVGSSIADLINATTTTTGIKATAKTSYNASEFNIVDVLNGDLNCGISQADDLSAYCAKNKDGKKLRALFTLHTEALTLLATKKSNINTYKDLKDKVVGLGVDSSLNHDIKAALQAEGIKPSELKQVKAKSVLCPSLIQKGKIDAYFFTVGHPNDNTKAAFKNKVKMISLSKQAIVKILKKYPYYSQVSIPLSYYKLNAKKIDTIGVKATFFASDDLDEQIIYNLTKDVFSNLDILKSQVPALQTINKKDMLKGILIPIHKGALKYYKEIGINN